MQNRKQVGRRTLLHKLPSLRYGFDSERNVLWIMTTFLATIIFIMILIDTVTNWAAITLTTFRVLLTFAILLLALIWLLVPVLMKGKFPHWLGLVAYIFMMVIIAYHFAFSRDPFSINTTFQVLPLAGLYLGWFWRPIPSRFVFGISMVGLVATAIYGPEIGRGRSIPNAVIFLALSISVFSFLVGATLRWQLQRKAMTDQLTGVLNLRGIKRAIRVEMARAKRNSENLSVAIIDFDSFKKINDTGGHAFGDQVLTTTVEEWKRSIRSYDSLGRLGGDEFVIVFPRTDFDQAAAILNRFRTTTKYSWSWGLAEMSPNEDYEEIIKRADADLYKNKIIKQQRSKYNVDIPAPKSSKVETVLQEPFFKKWYRTQSDFSLISSALAGVVLISLLVALKFSHLITETDPKLYFLIFALLLSAINTVVPILMGQKFTKIYAYFVAISISIIFIGIAIQTNSFFNTVSLLFASTLLALYLGVFLGTHTARATQIFTIIALGCVLMTKNTIDNNELEILLGGASIIYALITQLCIFEIGSYLYTRSRLHAHHDELTAMLNRHGLNDYGNTELQRAVRGNYALSVGVLDCIEFKLINDSQGHAKGDEMLRQAALHLKNNLEDYDLVARTGGDEFVVIMPYLNKNEAFLKLTEISYDSPIPWRFGVAERLKTDNLTRLISRADERMYTQSTISPKN